MMKNNKLNIRGFFKKDTAKDDRKKLEEKTVKATNEAVKQFSKTLNILAEYDRS